MMMATIHRFSHCLLPTTSIASAKHIQFNPTRILTTKPEYPRPLSATRRTRPSTAITRAGWFLGLGNKKKTDRPPIVKAGDPVLHEPARQVDPKEIGSEKIQKIIDDMVKVMRSAPGVGLAAPQIGVPLRIIVLEDTKEYISYQPKEEIEAQEREAFDLLVIVNPELRKKSDRTALFFEGCLRYGGNSRSLLYVIASKYSSF